MLLAPWFRLFPAKVAGEVGRAVNTLSFALACGLLARHAARRRLLGPNVPGWVPDALVAAAALAIPVLTILGVLLSEPLFTLVIVGTLVVADVPAVRWTMGRAIGAGCLAAAALMIRSIGIAALAGIVVYAWRARVPRRLIAIVALPAVVAGVWWALWVARHLPGIDPAIWGSYGTYAEDLRKAGVRALAGNLGDLPRPLSVLTLNWVPSRLVYYALGIPALLVGATGLVVCARRSLLGWLLLAYLGVLALWPYPPDRFLWAVLPLLGLAWAAGAVTLSGGGERRRAVPVALLSLALAFGYLRYEVRGLSGHWWDLAASGISRNVAELLPGIESLPSGTVVATDNEPMFWLYTRRPAVPFYLYSFQGRQVLQPTPAFQLAYLRRMGVTHVLLSDPGAESARQLDRLAQAYPGLLTVSRRWPGGRVLFEVSRVP